METVLERLATLILRAALSPQAMLPQRRAMGLGAPMTPQELRDWPHKVTDLFLRGCRAKR